MSKQWPLVSLGDLLRLERRPVVLDDQAHYAEIGIYCFGKGIFHKLPRTGFEVGDKDLFLLKKDDFILQITFAWEGAVAVVSEKEEGMYGSSRYPTFRVDEQRCIPKFLQLYFRTAVGLRQLIKISPGSAGRNRVLSIKRIPEVMIPLPPLAEQRRLVARIEALAGLITEAQALRKEAVVEVDALLISGLKNFPLPESAPRYRITDCATMSTGTTPPSDRIDYYGGPIQWYTPGDLNYQMALGKSTRTLSDVALQEGKARMFDPGTVLLVAIGASLGKVALAHERCSANQQITGIKFADTILPEFGFWWMRRLGKDLLAAAPQATLPIMNQKLLGTFEIVVPVLATQRRIVQELDALQAEVDGLKRVQAETQAELDALLPAVLEGVFKQNQTEAYPELDVELGLAAEP